MNQPGIKIGLRFGLGCLVAATLVGAGVVAAQMSVPATEPGGEVSEGAASFHSYFDGGIVAPENGLNAAGEPFAYPQGIAPDDNPPEGAARAQETNAPEQVFQYYMVSGATLRARSSATEYVYDGAGCTHLTAGELTTRILNAEANIPEGSEIKYLRIYFYDTHATKGVSGYITRYQPGIGPPPAGAGTLDLVNVSSDPGDTEFMGGYGFVVSQQISETVNNANYAYTVIGWPDDLGPTLRICGLRVAYYLPQNNFSYLPAVKAH